jgi:hypothetical protein
MEEENAVFGSCDPEENDEEDINIRFKAYDVAMLGIIIYIMCSNTGM